VNDDDTETKKLKIESKPSFINENISNKKICEYGEDCYRQKNPIHTAQYDHPRKF
jgi:hypothetical protein